MKKNRNILVLLLAAGLTLCFASCKSDEPSSDSPQVNAVTYMPKSAKRGVSFSFTQIMDLPLLSPYISWDYNWGNTPTDDAAMWFDANEMDYCPMCWNGNYSADRIRAFVAAHPKTRYLLAFNEPNLTDQANMTPAQAAALWQPVVALAKELNLKLVSPAMNYGTLAGYSDPVKWLDEFFAQPGVSPDDIYAIAIHCYMSSTSAVQGYVEKFYKYGKPIWMTEFCAWDPVPGSVTTQMDYMCAVLNYLETNPKVERYAWFIPRSGSRVDSAPYMQLLTHYDPPALTELGRIFCYFSPMDNTVWLKSGRFIHAGEYTQVNRNAITMRPSTDATAVTGAGRTGLMVSNFAEGMAISYQVYTESCNAIAVRYTGYSNCVCEVVLDGETQIHLSLDKTGSMENWKEVSGALSNVSQGAHTLTLKLLTGSCAFSGFQIR